MVNAQADIGLIGLAVMGQNIALNMNDHGFKVAVFNRTGSKTEQFMNESAAKTAISGYLDLIEFVKSLTRPRKILLMVKAGSAVDDFIDQLLPLLESGDIIIDGGNSHYLDTERRCHALMKLGMHFVGCGISGGEEGARHGPSMMPGGDSKAWPHIKPIFQSIAAQVEGEPCCEWVGSGGAGHYVKMVHNGIEYGDMQLICEAYHLMRELLKIKPDEMATVFEKWNKSKLESYLIEITAHIMKTKDQDGLPLIDKILDVAGQKGTGKWTVTNALDMGLPVTLISEAVFARCLSALKEERLEASRLLKGPSSTPSLDKNELVKDVEQALYASKIISYTQGFMLMREAAHTYEWELNYGSIAMMWRGGCIIRSRFLGEIKRAYAQVPELKSLLHDAFFAQAINECQTGWRIAISQAALNGIPVPCFSTALSFYDGYRCARLPANLLQAQRDYFGAHTYQRVDDKTGEFHHTNWTGTGGSVSSTSYTI